MGGTSLKLAFLTNYLLEKTISRKCFLIMSSRYLTQAIGILLQLLRVVGTKFKFQSGYFRVELTGGNSCLRFIQFITLGN